jgi:aspartate kinase
VELGELYNIPIQVSSSFNDEAGTIIHGGSPMEAVNKVRGIAHDLNVAKITIIGVPDQPGIASTIFQPLADANISVDTIVQNASIKNITDVSFTVARTDLDKAMSLVREIATTIGATDYVSDATLAKVSIIGSGMQNTPGYAALMFTTLSKKDINIQLITTSEIRITCIIAEDKVKEALVALHKAFDLEKGEL